MAISETIKNIKALTNKQFIFLTESGDNSILGVLKFIKNSRNTVLTQDQGGWLTYKDYAKKEGFNVVELKTNYGIIDLKNLETNANEKTALLVNSLTGYCAEQPMKEIFEICKTKKCLLINDVSGSIGTDNAKIGDIILGSFGKDKPINLNYGGFIATDKEEKFEAKCQEPQMIAKSLCPSLNTGSVSDDLASWFLSTPKILTHSSPPSTIQHRWNFLAFDDNKIGDLQKELDKLPQRLRMFEENNTKIKKDLSSREIIHKNHHGINVVVKFNNEKEKQELIDYCKQNNYEYTICPRNIRVNETAISIEVKRLR